jgi:dihydroorotate dehydrogenase (NAD+) catalytic subunit
MNLKVNVGGLSLKNPVITASGTYGFGREYADYIDLSMLGGITSKGLTLKLRQGNPPPRIIETHSGILNSVGLQNPGIDNFLNADLPYVKANYDTAIIANVAGNTIEDYCEMAEKLNDSQVDAVEVNISCPNVKHGGLAFGSSCESVGNVTKNVRKYCKKPLIIKLSPNVTDIAEIARAAEANGADSVSLINTLLGMKIDINKRRPMLRNNFGGLSGPAVKPVAVRMVYQVKQAVKIPIIGMGGIQTWEDAIEFMLAGATSVSVGTANFMNPNAPVEIAKGIEEYMKKYNIEDINDIIGKVELY